jgi:hypothetical protein
MLRGAVIAVAPIPALRSLRPGEDLAAPLRACPMVLLAAFLTPAPRPE